VGRGAARGGGWGGTREDHGSGMGGEGGWDMGGDAAGKEIETVVTGKTGAHG